MFTSKKHAPRSDVWSWICCSLSRYSSPVLMWNVIASVSIQVARNQWHVTKYFSTGQTYRVGRIVADCSYNMGTPFLCMQLSGVRLMGSNVLKKSSEYYLCLWGKSTAPVGHSVHLKNYCGLAYHTSSPPVISKSRMTLSSANGSSLNGKGATRQTQSCKYHTL